MNRTVIESAVIASASEISGVPKQFIERSTSFETLGFDSLNEIILVTAIEDEFGIDIGCAERMDLDTIDRVVDLVSTKTMRLAA